MSTSGAVRHIVPVKLSSIGEAKDDGKIQVKVMLPWSKHESTMFIPDEDLGSKRAGNEFKMMVEQGNHTKDKDGNPSAWDMMELNYWWNFVEFAAEDAEVTWVKGRHSSPSSDGGGSPQGDYRRSKEEMRFIDSMHITAQLIGPVATMEDLSDGYLVGMTTIAKKIYNIIEEVGVFLAPEPTDPAQQESAPARRPQQSPPQNDMITAQQTGYIAKLLKDLGIPLEEAVTHCKSMFGDHIQKPTRELTFEQADRYIEYLEMTKNAKDMMSGVAPDA